MLALTVRKVVFEVEVGQVTAVPRGEVQEEALLLLDSESGT